MISENERSGDVLPRHSSDRRQTHPCLILAGGGHAHLQLLDDWIRRGRPDCRTILVAPAPLTYYSGMVPGWMAGQYRTSDLTIDLAALARRAGVELIVGRIVGASMPRRTVTLAHGRELGFDWLSIATGGTDRSQSLGSAPDCLIPVRPIEAFVERWGELCPALRTAVVAIIGGGAAGVELALAVRAAHPNAQVHLVAGRPGLVPTLSQSVRRKVGRALVRRRVEVHAADAALAGDTLTLSSGSDLRIDCAIAATGSGPPRWLDGSGLALDPEGFVRVDACQRSVSHPFVFAAGDAARRADRAVSPAGVHAVRAGTVLARNLRAAISGQPPPTTYVPRKRTLSLLATGDRRAILSWGEWAFEGRWVWRLKDKIDRRWITKFGAA
jgi:pyridine nucleotide-disulfide oxidoreductase family protein